MRRIFLKSKELLDVIVKAIDDKKGENMLALDMQGISLLSDYVVIVHGNSNRQAHAIVDGVVEALKNSNTLDYKVEGNKDSDWILIDTKDVIVNVFTEEARDFYGLEKLWSDAPEVELESILN